MRGAALTAAAVRPRSARSILPGFGLTLGFTIFYLSAIVLIPLAALLLRPWSAGLHAFIATVTAPRVLAALRLSFTAAAAAAAASAVLGLVMAWTIERYRFPGRRIVDGLIDLPLALPTAVAGIALSTLYGPHGWLGAPLKALGIKVAYTPLGIVVALIFIGLPFVIRTLQPVIAELAVDAEEAAATLGATRLTTLARVVVPALLPAIVTGATLAFARSVGEYGSVIFIAGNLPMVSEIAPLLIVTKLEQFDYAGAAAIGVVMLLASLAILIAVNLFQHRLSLRR
jgi:sulfate transport system permease protein